MNDEFTQRDLRLPCGMVVRELDEPERETKLDRESRRADEQDEIDAERWDGQS